MSQTIHMASAVMVPEDTRDAGNAAARDAHGNSNGVKRRQSEVSDDHTQEQESKRRRTSQVAGKTSPTSSAHVEAPSADSLHPLAKDAEKSQDDVRSRSCSHPHEAAGYRQGETQAGPRPAPQECLLEESKGGGTRAGFRTSRETETSKDSERIEARGKKRGSGVVEEKQRSKRLFGALLGNLNNRPSDRNATRRAEIEQRRKAELKKQDDDRLEDKQKRLEKLAIHRRKVQIDIDEQNMHTRHKNMLEAADYLQTRAQPILYYKPWDLLDDEEDRIEDQLKDTQEQIDRELAEFEDQRRRRLAEIEGRSQGEADNTKTSAAPDTGDPSVAADPTDKTVNGDPNCDHEAKSANSDIAAQPAEVAESPSHVDDDNKTDSEAPVPVPVELPVEQNVTNSAESTSVAQIQQDEKVKEDAENEGDHVVENDEDAVIY